MAGSVAPGEPIHDQTVYVPQTAGVTSAALDGNEGGSATRRPGAVDTQGSGTPAPGSEACPGPSNCEPEGPQNDK